MLLVDNNMEEQVEMGKIFSGLGFHVETAEDGATAMQKIARDHYDLVISELNLPLMNGLDLLKKINEIQKPLPVIIVSDTAEVDDAVEAMKSGAGDFLVKPLTFEIAKIIASQVPSTLAGNFEEKETEFSQNKYKIITKNRKMIHLLEKAKKIAASNASIFLQGESGTGKELFARYIHNNSDRKDNLFVAINCSALPETLLESELFGHEKGAFTGASIRKKGKFEIADNGTLLLDEISEMDYGLQSKLLRVLQEKEIDRVGGTAPIAVNIRVIATTNRDIEDMVQKGDFREDLYYRLNVIPIQLPPLRERMEDIPLLAQHFIKKYNMIENRNVKGLTPKVNETLMKMSWKGNIREFENTMERAVLMCEGDCITENDFFISEKTPDVEKPGASFMPMVSLKEMEKKIIFSTLDHTNDNRTNAAKILGISVRTLRNKLNEYKEEIQAQ